MAGYHLLNVFMAPDGSFGNELGVFLDGQSVPGADRQGIATDLGYAETVFVDDLAAGRLRIFTPGTELPLAGHPLVGSAWLIARETGQCELLRPPAGEVPTWQDGDLRWIRARPEWAPDFELHGFGSAAEVDALDGPPEPGRNAYCWAWLDEPAGIARVRVFVPEAGVDEDEATGSGALLLCAHVGREIEIHQGRGSVLHARPAPDGTVDVGGRVGYVGEKPYG